MIKLRIKVTDAQGRPAHFECLVDDGELRLPDSSPLSTHLSLELHPSDWHEWSIWIPTCTVEVVE